MSVSYDVGHQGSAKEWKAQGTQGSWRRMTLSTVARHERTAGMIHLSAAEHGCFRAKRLGRSLHGNVHLTTICIN